MRGTDFPETIHELGRQLGVGGEHSGSGARTRATKPRPAAVPAATREDAAPISWTPSREPRAGELKISRLGEPSTVWRILDARGRLIALHCRWDTPDGEKTFRYWRNGQYKDALKTMGGSANLPLYGGELLSESDPAAVVIVCEGEKAADAARKALPASVVVLATACGAGTLPTAQALAVLDGRRGRVILWEDNDKPGREAVAKLRLAILAELPGLGIWRFAPEGLPEGGDAFEWTAARQGADPVDLLGEILAGAAKCGPAEDESPASAPEIASIPVLEFLETTLPPRPCLIRGLAYDRDAVGIHSFRGDGKSLVAVHLAAHAAAGRDFLAWEIPEPVGVLYVDGEMAQQEDQARLAVAVSIAGAPLAPFHILAADFFTDGLPSFATPEGQAVVERILESTPGIRLVIIDSVATLCTDPAAPDENSAESWSHSVGPWINSLRRRGYTPIVLYHDNKSGRQRGTSAREDYFAQVLQITRPDGWHRDQPARWNFTLTKSRGFHSGDARDFEATLGSDPKGQPEWTWRYADAARRDSATKARATRLAASLREGEELRHLTEEGGLTVEEAGERLGLKRRTAYARLKLLREHECAECGASKDAPRTHAHSPPVRDSAESHTLHTLHDGQGSRDRG